MTIIASLFNLIYYALVVLIFARIILSFTKMQPWNNQLARLVHDLTEPMLAPIRRLLPPSAGLDFSPMLLLIALSFLRTLLLSF